jgi:hypothetical protein
MKPIGVRIFEFIPEQNIFLKFVEIIFVNEKYGKELYLNCVDDAFGALLTKTEYKYDFLYGKEWFSVSKEMFKKLAWDEIDIDFVVM